MKPKLNIAIIVIAVIISINAILAFLNHHQFIDLDPTARLVTYSVVKVGLTIIWTTFFLAGAGCLVLWANILIDDDSPVIAFVAIRSLQCFTILVALYYEYVVVADCWTNFLK